MKEIKKQIRRVGSDGTTQINSIEGRIYERNPDTGQIRSRKFGDYGNERIEIFKKNTTL